MGSSIEINDTLQLTDEQGFPTEVLDLALHRQNPVGLADLKNQIFSFRKEDARIFHLDPCRVFLVQNINGKWLFWGHALIQSQEIKKQNAGSTWAGTWETSGTYIISQVYEPDVQKVVTMNQSPAGRSFF